MKYQAYEDWKARLTMDNKGELFFPGTQVSVWAVGVKFINGATLADLFDEYAFLNLDDVLFAGKYAREMSDEGK